MVAKAPHDISGTRLPFHPLKWWSFYHSCHPHCCWVLRMALYCRRASGTLSLKSLKIVILFDRGWKASGHEIGLHIQPGHEKKNTTQTHPTTINTTTHLCNKDKLLLAKHYKLYTRIEIVNRITLFITAKNKSQNKTCICICIPFRDMLPINRHRRQTSC